MLCNIMNHCYQLYRVWLNSTGFSLLLYPKVSSSADVYQQWRQCDHINAYQAPSTNYLVDDHDSGTARLMFVQSARVVYIYKRERG